MDTFKSRIIIILVSLLVFAGAAAGVLGIEMRKRATKQEEDLNDALASLRAAQQSRQAYYDSVLKQRELLRNQMVESKKTYEDLLAKQSDIIAGKQTQTTQMVQQTVPVSTTVPTSSSSSISTPKRSTRTS